MPRTPAESAQEVVRSNNEKAKNAVNALSPASRASLRQQGQVLREQGTKGTLSKNTNPTKDASAGKSKSQGARRNHAKAAKDKDKSSSPNTGAEGVIGTTETTTNPSSKDVSPEKTGTSVKKKPRRYPDYSGCVLSYTCPKTERRGHGIVGVCNHALGTYDVQFTFTDNEEPSGQTDSSLPLEFVEQHMVDDDVAIAWTNAVAQHLLIDSPTTKGKKTAQSQASLTTGKSRKSMRETPYDPREDEELTPSKKGPKRKRKSSVLVDPGIEAMVLHNVREATYDIRPSEARLRPFMYWNPCKDTACAKMLIKRTPTLRVMAEGYRRNEFARMISSSARGAGNNERSAQVRQIKLIYLDGKSDFALVSDYVIGASATGALKQMRISNALNGEFNDIEDLRTALYGPNMYTYEKLFDLFCVALESGRFRGTDQMPISPIENLITVAHEAHFRLELWYALTAQSFRHDTARVACEERAEKHHNLCKLVAQDRRDNGTLAFKTRNSTTANNDDDSDISDDSDEGVDSQFY